MLWSVYTKIPHTKEEWAKQLPNNWRKHSDSLPKHTFKKCYCGTRCCFPCCFPCRVRPFDKLRPRFVWPRAVSRLFETARWLDSMTWRQSIVERLTTTVCLHCCWLAGRVTLSSRVIYGRSKSSTCVLLWVCTSDIAQKQRLPFVEPNFLWNYHWFCANVISGGTCNCTTFFLKRR